MNKNYKSEVVATDWTSRKYRTAWMLTWLMTGLFAIPGIISFVMAIFRMGFEFTLLPASYYIPFVTGIWFAYFGANVVEKYKRLEKPEPMIFNRGQAPGDGYGGQPKNTDNP